MSEQIIFSIIICCYNSAERIKPTLKSVAGLNFDPNSFEVILVDNASEDNTSEIARDYWNQVGSKVSFSIIQNPVQGLNPSRKAGVLHATGLFILFCDDDMELDSDYLKIANSVLTSNAQIGVLGGRSLAKSDVDIPYWFSTYAVNYAVGCQHYESGDITFRRYVWGAGMIIRADFLKKAFQSGCEFALTDRKGMQLSSGGDSEICLWYLIAGYKLWYDDRLLFYHFMPAQRLTTAYLKKLLEGHADSARYIFDYVRLLKGLSFYQKIKTFVRRLLVGYVRNEKIVVHNYSLLRRLNNA